jgi:hypothetical protein
MKITKSALILSLALLTFLAAPVFGAYELRWGENVGLISAIVSATDSPDGLTVRLNPSQDSKSLTHLKPGTKIQGRNFRDGWVNLQSPVQEGWVPMASLKAQPFERQVTKVDQSEACLPLKKGPGTAYEKIGCALIGEILKFSGVATRDDWLQVADRNAWVPLSHVGGNWKVAAGTGKQVMASLPPEPAAPGKIAEKPAVEHVAEPGFPQRSPEEEDEGESPEATICGGEWCVDFATNAITRGGKPESFVSCARDETCAMILSEFWVALLDDDPHVDIPISDAMTIRLGRDGTIMSRESGILLQNCGSASGPYAECVAGFLLDVSQPLLGISARGTEPASSARR